MKRTYVLFPHCHVTPFHQSRYSVYVICAFLSLEAIIAHNFSGLIDKCCLKQLRIKIFICILGNIRYKTSTKFVNDFDFNSMLYYYLQQYLKEDEIPPDSACKQDSISHQFSHSKVVPIQQMLFLASQQANEFKSMNSTLDSDRIQQSAP